MPASSQVASKSYSVFPSLPYKFLFSFSGSLTVVQLIQLANNFAKTAMKVSINSFF